MNNFSKYVQITSNRLIITFPKGFYRGKALLEITLLSENQIETNTDTIRRENFKKLLLKRPSILTNEEMKHFKKISKWVKEWKPEEY